MPASRRAARSVSSPGPVSRVADEFGVCWWTVMNAVIEHGTPLVDDPDRVGAGPPARHRRDLVPQGQPGPRHRVRDRAGRSRSPRHDRHGERQQRHRPAALDRHADPEWIAGIKVVATDLAESFRAGLSPHLDHARRVADPFHVVRVGQPLPGRGAAAGSRTRRSAIGAASPTRCIGSASSCSPAPNASTSAAATGCCSACASVIPNDEVLGAWLAN